MGMRGTATATVDGLQSGRRVIEFRTDYDREQFVFECGRYIHSWVERNVEQCSVSVLQLELVVEHGEDASPALDSIRMQE